MRVLHILRIVSSLRARTVLAIISINPGVPMKVELTIETIEAMVTVINNNAHCLTGRDSSFVQAVRDALIAQGCIEQTDLYTCEICVDGYAPTDYAECV
jgi:hypothetical protein